ncbi:SirB2 family protein [Aggregatibacter kilianii]|uniref:SirB2 family protein n=1 Tax=Aggregatibacter kilianii TaxID=2025884 RepID=UPI000D658E2B|nr:SirB2 family protein [Aggregatibacter kilianii]
MGIYLVYLHIVCAFLSLGLLIVRGAMQLTQRDWRAVKLLKILPHLTDTLLILSGGVMLFMFNYGLPVWIVAKILLLAGYIVFSAKFFSKKQSQNRPHFFFLALAALIATILLGYFH